jgi:alpha-beta hydrolase superfamily lysophospholipase
LAELVMASGVGYLAGVYSASRWLTKPSPVRLQQTPGDYGLFFEDLSCDTADGERLAGWVVTPPRPHATLVLFHGVRHNREQLLGRIVFFSRAGYRCLAFDHRAHGQSTGKRTTFGFHESRDVAAVLRIVHACWPEQPCAALGLSMGAAALCYAAEWTCRLHALVLESVYHDIYRAFVTRMAMYPPFVRNLDHAILWVTERRLGLRLAQLAPADYMAALAPAPILLVTGADDPHATPLDTLRLYERCREPRDLLVISDAGHNDVFERGGSLYSERVLAFLEKHVRNSGAVAA